eukprot:TRINITY_DN6763_c0_g1_i1.p1 TRINITY_DN6763_c0_g1~~TRINITY_DN6763_c0_g1_i1.p1  ORF type:complete len:526 (+),score=158.63 TRINITY_DN6763_c0_g1_i1:89-1579(+)
MYERKPGLLALTNRRVLWQKRGEVAPELKLPVERVRKVQSNEEEENADAKVKLLEHGHEDGSGGYLFSVIEKADKWVYRNTFKELLEEMIRSDIGSKRSLPPRDVVTAKRRAQLVATDSDLRKVREKFMNTKQSEAVLREEEFWSVRSAAREKQVLDGEENDRGLPTALLDTPRPSTDASCNESRYCLTVDMIESIFRSYPDVRKEYLQRVPHEMSEREFWRKYIMARFFNRGKADTRAKVDKLVQVASSAQPVVPKVPVPEEVSFNPRVNLEANKLLPPGYGVQPDRIMQDSQLRNAEPTIARFNGHSHQVMEAQHVTHASSAAHSSDACLEKREKGGTLPLTVPNYRCYFASDSSHPHPSENSFGALLEAVESVRYESFDTAAERIGGEDSSHVLHHITLQCRERRKNTSESQIEPIAQQTNVYKLAHELLRHFWGCFPVSSGQKRDRLSRLVKSIGGMHKKLVAVAEKRKCNYLLPIAQQLQCALDRAADAAT